MVVMKPTTNSKAIATLTATIKMMQAARLGAPLSQYARIDAEIAGMQARIAELS